MTKRPRSRANEPEIGLDKMGMPIIDPAPDKHVTWEGTPAGKTFFKGGTWGMAVGLAVALYYTSTHSPLGFYTGNLVVVLLSAIAIGWVIGAPLGWLSFKIIGKDILPRTWIFGD